MKKSIDKKLKALETKIGKFKLYKAGLPCFPKVFARDSIISGILMKDAYFLRNFLLFAALRQGKKANPLSGEEPGKIFHEYPAKKIGNLSTEYAACDSNALFIIGMHFYFTLTKDKSFIKKNKLFIKRASDYILNHLNSKGAFLEDPAFCKANRFALNVTYWKDSELIERKHGIPNYPVCFTLAHIQNMAGLRSAFALLQSQGLLQKVKKMKSYLNKELFDYKTGAFYLAKDSKGGISAISSDLLHALFYLKPGDISNKTLKGIAKASEVLETDHGYSVLDPKKAHLMKNPYHSKAIWPFEQALIHSGAKKFKLKKIAEKASRILPYLDTNPEVFFISKKAIKRGGCDPQLWTIAAKKYFENQENSN